MTIFSPIQIIQIQSFGVTGTGVSDTFAMAGVKAGDVLLGANLISTGKFLPVGSNQTGKFIPNVATDGVMQQNGGDDFHAHEFLFTFLRFNQES